MNAFKKLETVMPWRLRSYGRAQHRKFVFWRAMRNFLRDPRLSITGQSSVLSELIYGWGNEDWSALEEYLQGCLQHAQRAEGPILECGTGLSTILLGVISQQRGNVVWSLEHQPLWGKKVASVLERYRISSAHLCISPLKDYGAFAGYDPPLGLMPNEFSMVVCDGPPGDTKGGRYGLLSVMRSRLKPGAAILLDDASRENEKVIAARWASELHTTYDIRGSRKPYILLRIPSGDQQTADG
jgi:hypothetical protein